MGKIFASWLVGGWLFWNKKLFSSIKNCNFKKLSLIMTSQTPYDTYPGKMISRAKVFILVRLAVLEELKRTQIRTDRTLLYSILAGPAGVAHKAPVGNVGVKDKN